MGDDNILFFNNPEKVAKQLRKVFDADGNQANNLSGILYTCIKNNNYEMFYEYLFSEIEFRGGIVSFANENKLNQIELRKFLRSSRKPDFVMLSKVLDGLNFTLKIVPKGYNKQ